MSTATSGPRMCSVLGEDVGLVEAVPEAHRASAIEE